MGSRCCFANCNTSSKCRGLSFHVLPAAGKSPEQDEWRARLIHLACRNDNIFNPARAKICSRHFEERCFTKTRKFMILYLLLFLMTGLFSWKERIKLFDWHCDRLQNHQNANGGSPKKAEEEDCYLVKLDSSLFPCFSCMLVGRGGEGLRWLCVFSTIILQAYLFMLITFNHFLSWYNSKQSYFSKRLTSLRSRIYYTILYYTLFYLCR